MTATKFIITAAALSSFLVGGAANTPSINSIIASSTKGFFGVNDKSARQGWNIATSIRGGSTEEPKKKKKKKSTSKSSKKKKVIKPDATSKTASKDTAAPKTDLSEAILSSSQSKNAMKVYSYSEEDSGHSVVGMTESAMLALGVFDGDTVFVKGKRGKKTVATVAMVSDSDAASLASGSTGSGSGSVLDEVGSLTIGMPSDAMKNAGVRAGDAVKFTPAPDVKFGKNVLILPYQDSIDSVSDDDMAEFDVFDDYIRPYFE